jgi:hypothetical protein
MMIRSWKSSFVMMTILTAFALPAMAQSSSLSNSSIEDELNRAEGLPSASPAIPPPPAIATPAPKPAEPLPEIHKEIEAEQAVSKKTKKSNAAIRQEKQNVEAVLKRHREEEVQAGENVNRYPKEPPLFVKPEGPVQGGTIEVDHPNAAKGLIRINKDGTYQYGVRVRDGKRAASFRVSMMTPPSITSADGKITYKDMYGTSNMMGAAFDYEWRPFRSFGTLGIQIGTGVFAAQGKGFFSNTPPHNNMTNPPQDKYTLLVFPLNLFAVYRFDYNRKQWLVPYVKGGGTLYGLAEIRSDYTDNNFNHSEAIGGGGGVMVSVGRLSPSSRFELAREYNISDMWVTLEARAMESVNKKIDFSNQVVELGIVVDY